MNWLLSSVHIIITSLGTIIQRERERERLGGGGSAWVRGREDVIDVPALESKSLWCSSWSSWVSPSRSEDGLLPAMVEIGTNYRE